MVAKNYHTFHDQWIFFSFKMEILEEEDYKRKTFLTKLLDLKKIEEKDIIFDLNWIYWIRKIVKKSGMYFTKIIKPRENLI